MFCAVYTGCILYRLLDLCNRSSVRYGLSLAYFCVGQLHVGVVISFSERQSTSGRFGFKLGAAGVGDTGFYFYFSGEGYRVSYLVFSGGRYRVSYLSQYSSIQYTVYKIHGIRDTG